METIAEIGYRYFATKRDSDAYDFPVQPADAAVLEAWFDKEAESEGTHSAWRVRFRL